MATKWLVAAEARAELPKLTGGVFHPYRRLWATERKNFADVDVAASGGWKGMKVLKLAYQQSDPASVLAVVVNDHQMQGSRFGNLRICLSARVSLRSFDSEPALVIELGFGHLADYATVGANGKLIVVGIFDRLFAKADEGVQLPLCVLVMQFRASISDGPTFKLKVQLADDDENEFLEEAPEFEVALNPSGPGRPTSAAFILQLLGTPVPTVGDYHFCIYANGRKVGSAPLYVEENPTA